MSARENAVGFQRLVLSVAVVAWMLAPLLLVAWLVWRDWAPAGHLRISTGTKIFSTLVRGPVPEARVRGPFDGSVYQVVGQPVYFDVRQSRPFRTATIALQLDPGSADVIELGVASNQQLDNLTLQPLFHRALEWLARDPEWNVLSFNGVTLYQRGRMFSSVSEFFARPPEPQRVMVYRASADLPIAAAPLPPTGPTPEIDYIITGDQPKNPSAMRSPVQAAFLLTAAQAAASELRLVISMPEGSAAIAPRIGALSVQLNGDLLSMPVLRGWISQWFPAR